MPADPVPLPQGELDRLRAEVRERDDLLAMAAHELRNPLHALSLQLRLARMSAEGGDAAGSLQRVAKAEVMLERYVERLSLLLDLARLNANAYPLELRRVDLSRTLSQVAETMAPEAEFRSVSMRLDLPPSLEVTTDAAVVEQIVSNLLLNAFKHADCRTVTLAMRPDGDAAVIVKVADDGRGITPADQQRIFTKFGVAQESPRGSGTGLGLWIVRKLLAALGGSLSLDSRPQAGSEFTLRIPSSYGPP
jgi:signal transduction histidine kinase